MSAGRVHASTNPFAPSGASLNETIYAWQDDALCAETDPDAFFVEKGGDARPAKAVCAKCTVTEQCLAYALAHPDIRGVFGGTTQFERRKAMRKAKAEAANT